MKNQYFGDIGDYGKYGLLRFLSMRGITIAVNWYLTMYRNLRIKDSVRIDPCGGSGQKRDIFCIEDL